MRHQAEAEAAEADTAPGEQVAQEEEGEKMEGLQPEAEAEPEPEDMGAPAEMELLSLHLLIPDIYMKEYSDEKILNDDMAISTGNYWLFSYTYGKR